MKDVVKKLDLMVISLSVLVLMAAVGFVQPRVIGPINGYETTATQVLFSVEKGNVLLVDDNMEFTTPDEYSVVDGLELDLVPGIYYWKVVGVGSSKIRTLTINSKVSLEFVDDGENYSVVNSGNVDLLVDIYNGTDLLEKRKLGIDEELENIGTKFVGEVYG